ncbi:MAG: DHHA1 domain-containing protein, partial [bacterium]
ELSVEDQMMSRDEAEEAGALAFFGEHYGENVRVVSIGDVSKELCGGTHLTSTAELGVFTITNETSVASGVRRIEARAGEPAYNYFQSIREELEEITEVAGVQRPEDVPGRLEEYRERIDEYEQELERLRAIESQQRVDQMVDEAEKIGGIQYLTETLDDVDNDTMKTMIDEILDQLEQGVVLLVNKQGPDSVQIVMGVDDELTDRISAGNWVGELGRIVDGGGGGRPDFAQAGGSNPDRIQNVLKTFQDKLEETVGTTTGS